MEIVPNVGIGNVRFGMSPAEVLAHFPEEQMYEDWMGGNLNDSLLFHGLIFGFDKCDSVGPLVDSRLMVITVFGREDAWLWGQSLRNWFKDTVTAYLERSGLAYELQASGDVLLRSHALSLSFAQSGQLEYVEAWVRIDDSDSAIRKAVRSVRSFLARRA